MTRPNGFVFHSSTGSTCTAGGSHDTSGVRCRTFSAKESWCSPAARRSAHISRWLAGQLHQAIRRTPQGADPLLEVSLRPIGCDCGIVRIGQADRSMTLICPGDMAVWQQTMSCMHSSRFISCLPSCQWRLRASAPILPRAVYRPDDLPRCDVRANQGADTMILSPSAVRQRHANAHARFPPGKALMLGMAIRSISWSLNVCWCDLAYANACCNPAGAAPAGNVYSSNAANSIKTCKFAVLVTAILNLELDVSVSCHKPSIRKQTAKCRMHVLENGAGRSLTV